jgi:multicomponent Na+:H+ antiporter subunit B
MMKSLILQTATRSLVAVLLLFSIFLLLRGHDEPGGGFIGGLVGAAAFALYAIAFDVPAARRMLGIRPQMMIAIGLAMAGSAGVISLLAAEPYLRHLWYHIEVPGFGEIHLGTFLLFDIGVFLVVIGVTLLIVLTLAEE